MNCPSCTAGKLIPGYLDDLFPSHVCQQCAGHWIYLTDYLRWLEYVDKNALALACDNEVVEEPQDTKRALICPKTGMIMLKYRISATTSHRIDLSPSISAIWLDKGEWELIKQQNLATSLNKIFTAPWQRQIKAQTAANVLSGNYLHQLGEEKYNKIKDFRQWLDEQPDKNLMLAYLTAKDPYSAIR